MRLVRLVLGESTGEGLVAPSSPISHAEPYAAPRSCSGTSDMTVTLHKIDTGTQWEVLETLTLDDEASGFICVLQEPAHAVRVLIVRSNNKCAV